MIRTTLRSNMALKEVNSPCTTLLGFKLKGDGTTLLGYDWRRW